MPQPIRHLTADDVPQAHELSTLAHWNQTERDWRMLLELAPHSCFVIEADGRLVATATLLCYGDTLAWLGMVLTHPAYRQRGYASQLLEKVLAIADERKVKSVKLDATDQGQPLYEKLGFRVEQQIERWTAEYPLSLPTDLEAETFISRSDPQPQVSLPLALDQAAFGANRSDLLEALAVHSVSSMDRSGFAFGRPGRKTFYMGPCVAQHPETAERHIAAVLSTQRAQPWSWDLFTANAAAIGLAQKFGFLPDRRLFRMVRGEDSNGGETTQIYAAAGFELG